MGLKKFVISLLLLGGVVFALAGCGTAEQESQDAESQVIAMVQEYYDSRIRGEDEAAADLLLFSEATQDMKQAFPGAFQTTPVQSYTIREVSQLTEDLYRVNIVGVFLTPYELVYNEDGEVVGTSFGDGRPWYVNSFDKISYAAYVDGKWGFCISAQYVPDGMYDFPEEELGEIPTLPLMTDEDDPQSPPQVVTDQDA
jgi:hypothetical protein